MTALFYFISCSITGFHEFCPDVSTKVESTTIVTNINNHTLYAHWTGGASLTVTITYDANGGTGEPAAENVEIGSNYTISTTVPTRRGYAFKGWSTNPSATIANYTSGGTIPAANVVSDITLYAVWEKNIEAYAVYSADDNSLTFYKTNDIITEGQIYNGKTATAVYTGFETEKYTSDSQVPWYSNRENIITVKVSNNIAPTSTAYWFDVFKNTTQMDLTKLDTSSVTNMSYMFSAAGYNASTFTLTGLDYWNTSSVTDMKRMFFCAGQNVSEWNIGNLSNWNTSSVTNMYEMFYCTGMDSSEWNIGNLSNWDTSSVTDMSGMFSNAGYRASEWNIGNLSNWNTSSVTNMSSMFYGAGANASTFTLTGLDNWDTSSVTDMNGMFRWSGYYSAPFSLNLSGWDTRSVTNGSDMFKDCRKLKEITIGENFTLASEFPIPNSLHIPGADGNWYNKETGASYTPSTIPANTAATYVAVY